MKEITLKSGRKIQWHKCPRYVLWRHGRTAHTFQLKAQEAAEAEILDPVERGLSMFEALSEPEAKKLQAFADDVVKNSTDVKDPDDLSELDYWEVFGRTLFSSPDAPIETKDGETDSKSVETFPDESKLQDAGEDVSDVPSESECADGHTQSASV